ncbi:MAG: MBL fold metallo-hydrolase [Chloroflexota bacterium]|nr:MBL fold metallo-hydrolase [Chloroflexota bacterium]
MYEIEHMIETQLTYFGTNTLIIKKGTTKLLIDPHFSRPGVMRMLSKIAPNQGRVADGLSAAKITNLDAVLLTHTHYDHAMDVPEIFNQVGGTMYGSPSALNLLQGGELPPSLAHVVKMGKTYQTGNFQVVFHPSRHLAFPLPLNWLLPNRGQIAQPLIPPAWFWRYQSGEVYAIQIDRMLIFGSAACISGAYHGLEIQTVVLGIGGLAIKTHAYIDQLYQHTVLASGARNVWLSHWDNFFNTGHNGITPMGFTRRTIQQIKKLGNHYGQSVSVLPYGKTIQL